MFYGAPGSAVTGVLAHGTREDSHPTGVIDHCFFDNQRIIVVGWGGYGSLTNVQWAQPSPIGTGNAVFVEDCEFTYTDFQNVIDANYGGRYVFRNNTVDGAYVECHSVQQNHRATRSWEIYGNRLASSPETYNPWITMSLRGGTGVVFDNIVADTNWGTIGIGLDNVRTLYSKPGGGLADGNTEPIETYRGWPARDQIGRGQDEWAWTDENPYPPQASEPAYFWNNKRETGEDLYIFVRDGFEIHIQQNRDYYVGVPRPGYTPYTYPHPLIQEWDESGTSAPAAPSSLRIYN